MTRLTLHCVALSAVVFFAAMPGCTVYHAPPESRGRQYPVWLDGLSDTELDTRIARLESELGYTGRRRPRAPAPRPAPTRRGEPARVTYTPIYHQMASTAVPIYSARWGPPAMPLRVTSGSFSGGTVRGLITGTVSGSFGGGRGTFPNVD